MNKILIIDDEKELFLEPTVRALESVGKYKIYAVTKSEEALQIIKKRKIDVFIADYLLKGDTLNGDDIIRIIRNDEKKHNYKTFLPCILITGTEGKKNLQPKLLDLKMNFHDKIDGPAALIDKIDECVKEKKAKKKKKFFSDNKKRYIIYPLLVVIIGGIFTALFTFYLRNHWENKIEEKNFKQQSDFVNIAIKVFSEGNKPIQNANVMVEGMADGKYTDNNGYTSLKIQKSAVHDKEVLLNISKSGYKTSKKRIYINNQNLTINLRKN